MFYSNKFLFSRFLLSVVLILSVAWVNASQFDKGLLWQVESPSGKTSHLFGTIHLEDPRVTTLPAPVKKAFDESATVVLEMTMDASVLIKLSLTMMLTDGRNLESIVGKPLYQQVLRAMESYGMPEMVVAQMKPWAVATTLITPRPKTGVVLDMKLYQDAMSAGKQVDGLESAMEQLSVFDDMDEKLQIKMLKDALDQLPEMSAMYEEMLQIYLERDLAKMVSMSDRYMKQSDSELSDHFNEQIIVNRNHRMVERMQSNLKAGDAFIAVGTLHLPGEEGLLNLLQKKGYKLSRIY
jgi:uncharacterized protein YbaP (TraB family)